MFTGIKDIDIEILIKLDNKSLCSVFKCNRFLHNYSKNENLWRRKMLGEFPKRSIGFLKDPIRMYSLIREKAKLFELTKERYLQSWEIKNKYLYGEINKISAADVLNCVTAEIYLNFDNKYIFRGDFILFFNNFLLIWTGEKAIFLDAFTILGNNMIPKEFSFPEFPLDHFHNSMVYSIYISPEKMKEAIINFSELEQRSFITDLQNTYFVKIPWTHHITREQFAEHITKHPYIDDYEATFSTGIIETIYCFSK